MLGDGSGTRIDRRGLLLGSVGVLAGLATGCDGSGPPGLGGRPIGPHSAEVQRAEEARRGPHQALVSAALVAAPATIDLGGRSVETWAYDDAVPGPVLRTSAGDLLRVRLTNDLPTATSIHWHGLALRNDMDGVPGITQDPIPAGATFTYEFTTPDPGTYFFHPHSGVQLDRGLYGVLVVADPAERGEYDEEWVVVLDDWLDGTGRTPDEVLGELLAGSGHGGHGGMGGVGGMSSPLLGGAGDIDYPHYLVNGRTPDAPVTLSGRPGQRIRLRLVNAGSDTAFRVGLGGHRMRVTHSDGFPVVPRETDGLLIGMGERYDVVVELGDGVFPLLASAEGKSGGAFAVVRTASGPTPAPEVALGAPAGRVLLGRDLAATDEVRLDERSPDRRLDAVLAGGMMSYRWTINGATFPDARPLELTTGERVRLRMQNRSMMFHPMHLHGHTFAVVTGGARKDTAIVRPMETLEVDVQADNPGQWAFHCHNLYHAEAGMMTRLSYRG